MKDLIEKILSLRWFYRFDLPGGRTTETYVGEGVVRFHEDRLAMLNSVIDQLYTDSLTSKTCIDLACHQGFYSVKLAQRGLQKVTGLDARKGHIKMAKLIKEVHRLENLSFMEADVRVHDHFEDLTPSDITLFFGLIYHLENPIRALRLTRSLTKEVCIIETQVAPSDAKAINWGLNNFRKDMQGYFAVIDETAERANDNLETGLSRICLCPSSEALTWILHEIGFREVSAVPPHDTADEQLLEGNRLMLVAKV